MLILKNKVNDIITSEQQPYGTSDLPLRNQIMNMFMQLVNTSKEFEEIFNEYWEVLYRAAYVKIKSSGKLYNRK
ncbi:hypothetical protein GCM10026987_06420 [Belliella aquatica]|uniref:Uncharacterized protein n=1 Tax=Belliella aquatica TaxID=1323734 RepID=A0ABQ1MW42_9BACT|nr:hypothetical protein GCM10010993_28320 [Belliella aquatica]